MNFGSTHPIASPRRTAFTLVELLVVIGIIALLVGILLPALSKSKQAGLIVACASNMRQIGIAIEAYATEYGGTYPPAVWTPDWRTTTGNYSRTKAIGFDGFLRPYLGRKDLDPSIAANVPAFLCPADTSPRADYFPKESGPMTYFMPTSTGSDNIFFNQRVVGVGSNPPRSGDVLNRGIGQMFLVRTDKPMWIKKKMVKPSAEVLLLVERAFSHGAQSPFVNEPNFPYGYAIHRPGMQMYFIEGQHGNPLIHTRLANPAMAKFNYLFADNHVEFLAPKDTVNQSRFLKYDSYSGDWEGADKFWTIRPGSYRATP